MRLSIFYCARMPLVQGKTIFGTVFNGGEDWVSWKTTLDHSIGRITSNADGTVVAASTLAGSVALLSGERWKNSCYSDGKQK